MTVRVLLVVVMCYLPKPAAPPATKHVPNVGSAPTGVSAACCVQHSSVQHSNAHTTVNHCVLCYGTAANSPKNYSREQCHAASTPVEPVRDADTLQLPIVPIVVQLVLVA
jgi:hypothetical protein